MDRSPVPQRDLRVLTVPLCEERGVALLSHFTQGRNEAQRGKGFAHSYVACGDSTGAQNRVWL